MKRSAESQIKKLMQLSGVEAVLLAGTNGMVIEHASSGEIDMEKLGSLATMAIGGAESLGNEHGLGGVDQYMAEFADGKLVIATAGDGILAVLAGSDAVIGNIRHQVKKAAPAISKVI